MKYNVGDRVRIKSIDWYNENKDEFGEVRCKGCPFVNSMTLYCNSILTIEDKTEDCYWVKENTFNWTDEMIEGIVEEENINNKWNGLKVELELSKSIIGVSNIESLQGERFMSGFVKAIIPPEGYIFKDENSNEILTNKIILEKANTLKTQSDNMETETHRGYYTTEEDNTNKSKKVAWFTFGDNDFADRVELDLSDRELIQEDGKWFAVKKENEYPKTYEECCKVLEIEGNSLLINTKHITDYERDLGNLMGQLHKLIICRDAYWKLAGEEMGLGKPWEPDWGDGCYVIITIKDKIQCGGSLVKNYLLAFPTEEMRDAFYENFKKEIEICKELL